MDIKLSLDAIYTIFSSIISANGLISNSMATVIGSMLISPYLNPMNKFSQDYTSKGIINTNELIKIIIYFTISISIGYVYYSLYIKFFMSRDKLKVFERDHKIMEELADFKFINIGICSFVIGAFLAFLTLKPYNSYNIVMVGVNIAVSLLPTVVNAGIYLARKDLTKSFYSLMKIIINMIMIFVGFLFYYSLSQYMTQ